MPRGIGGRFRRRKKRRPAAPWPAPAKCLSVACIKCGAIEGEPCMMPDETHYENDSYFHAARRLAAASLSDWLKS